MHGGIFSPTCDATTVADNDYDGSAWLQEHRYVSPLAQVHWLRLVQDEGHSLSKSGLTDVGNLMNALVADRRWVMTGTPFTAKGTGSGSANRDNNNNASSSAAADKSIKKSLKEFHQYL